MEVLTVESCIRYHNAVFWEQQKFCGWRKNLLSLNFSRSLHALKFSFKLQFFKIQMILAFQVLARLSKGLTEDSFYIIYLLKNINTLKDFSLKISLLECLSHS